MRKLIKGFLIAVTMFGICFLSESKIIKAEELIKEPVTEDLQEQIVEEPTDQPEITVDVEGIVFNSDEEAFTYLEDVYDIQVPYSYEVRGQYEIVLEGDVLMVTFSTISGIGTASLIGVKNVYVQYATPGSDMVGNHVPSGTFTKTNNEEYSGFYQYKMLEKGYQYRGKQTHFVIVNGVEYTYTTYTKFVNYYC